MIGDQGIVSSGSSSSSSSMNNNSLIVCDQIVYMNVFKFTWIHICLYTHTLYIYIYIYILHTHTHMYIFIKSAVQKNFHIFESWSWHIIISFQIYLFPTKLDINLNIQTNVPVYN